MIAISNAGGISGAGSNIPVMLIFFGLDKISVNEFKLLAEVKTNKINTNNIKFIYKHI